jgi:formylglycine-generating enzyme required for sulfatase activity
VDRTNNTHRSPFGAVDMPGNTWEWVADWYKGDYYRNAPNRNPKGPASGNARVLRGGSWFNIATWIFRAAYRSYGLPTIRFNWLSFRCAKAP